MDKLDILRPDPRLAGLLAEYPAELFNERLYQSVELTDRYCLELTIAILQHLGVNSNLQDWRSAEQICQDFQFTPRFLVCLNWLLERLAAPQLLLRQEIDGNRHYRLADTWRQPEPEMIYSLAVNRDPSIAATLDLLKVAADAYPMVAKGEISGEELILGSHHIDLWLAYFQNRNPSYAVNNWVSAIASSRRLADKPRFNILEVGAGAGSGTEALLTVLTEHDLIDRLEHYLVTEPGAFLRRRCERYLKTRFKHLPLEFRSLDIDKPWAEQGVRKADYDLVYAVNTLHIADDLLFSLGEARNSLATGGWLVAGECLRPFPNQQIYIELVFQLLDSFINVSTDPVLRPNPGFLTAQQWYSAFTAAGFEQVQITPDQERIRQIYPRFFIGAICGC